MYVVSIILILILNFSVASQTDLLNEIQSLITKAYLEVAQSELEPNINTPELLEADSTEELLPLEQNFQSLFTTIVWFLEHDPYTSIAMNLDINC